MLNQKYTQSFFDLQNGLQSVKEQTNAHFDNFFEKEKSFFDNATTTLSALEKQYRENLALKAPAEYWKDLETDYRKKSRFWMIMSAVVSAIIVALLGAILFFTQGIFVDKTNWLENAKISVIITVIISVSIYMLRTTIKMAISSLHLSRDAKERQNLSVFYLSLIEDGAVTDKERSIIINALFSRVDTGLLKGDSSPAMSNNVTDLIGIVKNIK